MGTTVRTIVDNNQWIMPSRRALERFRSSPDLATSIGIMKRLEEVIAAKVFLRRCSSVGPYVQLQGRPCIRNNGTIKIGGHARIHSTIVAVELASEHGGELEIGEHTFLNYGISISAHELVRIGNHCLLGTYVNIMDNNWHGIFDRRRAPPSKPVIVGDNVWLGNRVIVLPGVTIGQDSVVGAASVVVKDIPARCVAVGNPARVVRTF